MFRMELTHDLLADFGVEGGHGRPPRGLQRGRSWKTESTVIGEGGRKGCLQTELSLDLAYEPL